MEDSRKVIGIAIHTKDIEKLRVLALNKHTSISELIRRAVREYLRGFEN